MFIVAEVSIEKIESRGLLLGKIADGFTYDKAIRLAITTPHDEYVQQQAFIKKCIQTLGTMRNVSGDSALDDIISELSIIYNTISDMNDMISTVPARNKRFALFPWVGRVYEVLFGFVSESTLNEVRKDINDVDGRITLISDVVYNQTAHSIDTIISIQAKNKDTDNKIQGIIEKLNELINVVAENEDKLEQEMQTNNLIQLLTLAVIRYRSFQNKIVSYILKQEPSHIDPEIFPLSLFRIILEEIDSRINETDILPWHMAEDEELINWYQVIQMKISIIKGYLLVEMNIPLISIAKWEVFETIPAPFSFGRFYVMINMHIYMYDVVKMR